jgi:hypothetical protein
MIHYQAILGIDLLNLTLGLKHALISRLNGSGTVSRTMIPSAPTTLVPSQLGFYMLAKLMAQLNHI